LARGPVLACRAFRRFAVRASADEAERKLASIADRLDGTGLWAVSKAVWRAQEKVVELKFAIEEGLRRP
jgi:hypothetical protein